MCGRSTLAHPDRNNWGVTGLLAIKLSEILSGGSHVLTSHDLSSAVVVEDSPHAIMVAGDYARVMRAPTRLEHACLLNAHRSKDPIPCLRRAWQMATWGRWMATGSS
jgi:hypothetical protein